MSNPVRGGNEATEVVTVADLPRIPSTEAVGEVRREVHESCAAIVTAELEAAGWVGPKAIEVLFEQRDTAIAEATKLRAEVERLRALVGDEDYDRERWQTCTRAEAIRQANEFHDSALTWMDRHEQRRVERDTAIRERNRAIADLKAFGGEVERLHEVEREAERMRQVVEAAKAWALAIFGEDWVQIPGDEDHYGETELTLAEAVDAYTKEASNDRTE